MNIGKNNTVKPGIRLRSPSLESSSISSSQPPDKRARSSAHSVPEIQPSEDSLNLLQKSEVTSFNSDYRIYRLDQNHLDMIFEFLDDIDHSSYATTSKIGKKQIDSYKEIVTSLAISEISHNDLKSVCENFPKLKSLTFQCLDDNQLELVCASFPQLKSLFIENAGDISDEGIKHLGKMNKLEELELVCTNGGSDSLNYSEENFKLILSLPKLKILRVEHPVCCTDQVVNMSIDENKLANLECLDINSDCHLSYDVFKRICSLKNIKTLELWRSCLKPELFYDLLAIGDKNNIQHLMVSEEDIGVPIDEEILDDADNPRYDFSAIEAILKFPKIKTLELKLWEIENDSFIEQAKEILDKFPKLNIKYLGRSHIFIQIQ